MNFAQKISITLAAIALAGCAGMSKKECTTKDWYQAGYNAGAHGKFKSNLASEQQACARYDVAIDTAQYAQGWEAGVRQFCQPSRAMQMGINGEKYNPVCPADTAGAFESTWRKGLRQFCVPKKGYQLGRSGKALPDFCAPDQAAGFTTAFQEGYRVYQRVSDLQAQLKRIDGEIRKQQNNVADSQRRIDRWVNKLKDPQVLADPVAVESIRVKIKETNRHISTLNRNVSLLRVQRAGVQSKLDSVQAQG